MKKCKVVNSTVIECLIPQIKDKRLVASSIVDYSIHIQFNDQTKRMNQQVMDYSIQVYPDPDFKPNQVFSDKTHIILIEVSF